MVTFAQKVSDDTVNIKIVYTDISKLTSAVNGFDIANINGIIDEIKSDRSIKNVNICLNYYDDESKLVTFLQKYKTQSDNSNNTSDDTQNKNVDKKYKQKSSMDYTCPDCGSEDSALVDKYGNKYPCLSCLQINIGQKIMSNIKPVLEKNNYLIDGLCKLFSEKGKQE
jgi:transcription elongation factor Elf1